MHDVIKGWRFCATMMPWVRLSVLQRHGEFNAGPIAALPTITENSGEGMWLPVTVTLRELGIDVDEPQLSMSSAVGYLALDGGEFLPFLMEMRECVENEGDDAYQRACLETVLAKPRWAEFVAKLDGEAEIMRRFRL